MKIVGITLAALVGLFVVIGINSAPSPELKAERDRFCAKAPHERELVLQATWERQRYKPGSPWMTYQEFKGDMRRHMGC